MIAKRYKNSSLKKTILNGDYLFKVPGWIWVIMGTLMGISIMWIIHYGSILSSKSALNLIYSLASIVALFVLISLKNHYLLGAYSRALKILIIGMPLVIVVFALVYTEFGIMDSNSIVIKDFVSALYFSIVTWTTLGYGDFKPTADVRFYAAAEALLGYVYMGILIGTVFSSLSREFNQDESPE